MLICAIIGIILLENIMLKSNHKNFISMLSEEKPVVCFYHVKEEDEQIKKIKETLAKVKKELPLLPLYEFIRDETEQDEHLCNVMEVTPYPVIIVYKNGCFNRYKDKNFTEKELLKFIGNKTLYSSIEEKAKDKIEVDL